ncbi:LOW QUALITY PROTEIN: activating signal cointegrator 1 complex subunit 3 isoform X4 [Populus alba x Populus x berolinensis]|nr:LOW QUALITY PROTEIN: activating signal cointegrator 1 complex subunit 3 isoform X4 [Populus alba x Populus x berolinensis]
MLMQLPRLTSSLRSPFDIDQAYLQRKVILQNYLKKPNNTANSLHESELARKILDGWEEASTEVRQAYRQFIGGVVELIDGEVQSEEFREVALNVYRIFGEEESADSNFTQKKSKLQKLIGHAVSDARLQKVAALSQRLYGLQPRNSGAAIIVESHVIGSGDDLEFGADLAFQAPARFLVDTSLEDGEMLGEESAAPLSMFHDGWYDHGDPGQNHSTTDGGNFDLSWLRDACDQIVGESTSQLSQDDLPMAICRVLDSDKPGEEIASDLLDLVGDGAFEIVQDLLLGYTIQTESVLRSQIDKLPSPMKKSEIDVEQNMGVESDETLQGVWRKSLFPPTPTTTEMKPGEKLIRTQDYSMYTMEEALCTCRLDSTSRMGTCTKMNLSIIYDAPMKALAAEVTSTFSHRLSPLNMTVRELTGDMQLSKSELEETQMIVTTPEKWDVITRKNSDKSLSMLVKLLIIEEVHLLNDDRGPVIEALVARTLRQVESTQTMIRIVGLSATLPNYLEVAQFLRVSPETGLFFFDSSYRPVPLAQQYIGISEQNFAARNELLNEICYKKVVDSLKQGHQAMVFVHSRKDTAKTAEKLVELARNNEDLELFRNDEHPQFALFKKEVIKSRNKDLVELFGSGVGVHHAGMLRADRGLTERLFSGGLLKVLVCTATLAWGVNLPAHTVVIKGTQLYDPKAGGWRDLGMLDVMQIFGRAGRPQFDKSGEGIIITSHDKLAYYLRLLTSQLPIESQFISSLKDNLNAEVALGTVTNVKEACAWLGYTYLFIRMRQNPLAYGIGWDEDAFSLPLNHLHIGGEHEERNQDVEGEENIEDSVSNDDDLADLDILPLTMVARCILATHKHGKEDWRTTAIFQMLGKE